jgi:hypothetical protein
MANEIRARFNLVSGTLSGSLTNVATSMSAAGLANLGVIDATNYAAITIENEVVWVTAHTGGATTATILRAQEGTSAVAHNSGVAWQHGPTAFDLGTDWTSYTPTLTQSATVTKTMTYAKYVKVGRMVTVQGVLAVTGTGTASQPIIIGLPVTSASSLTSQTIGTGYVLDVSAGAQYLAHAIFATATSIYLLPSTGTAGSALGSSVMTAALASGDTVAINVTYESLA